MKILINDRIKLMTLAVLLLLINGFTFVKSVEIEKNHLQNELKEKLITTLGSIQSNLRENTLALSRMANRWNQKGGIPELEWRHDAKAYSKDLLGVVGVGYANIKSKIKWIEFNDKEIKTTEIFRGIEDRIKESIPLFVEYGKPLMVEPISLKENDFEFLVLAPVYKTKSLDGFVYFISNVRDYFTKVVKIEDISYIVRSNNKILFKSKSSEDKYKKNWYVFSFKGFVEYSSGWEVEVFPSDSLIQRHYGRVSLWAMIISFLFSCFLFFIYFLLLKTQKLCQRNLTIDAWQKTILNSTDFVVISTDLSGKVMSFNAAAENFLGYKANEIINKCTPQFWHVEKEIIDRADVLKKEYNKNISPGFEVFIYEANLGIYNKSIWTFITKTGLRKRAGLSVNVLKGVSNKVIGYVGFIEEVSNTLEIQEQLLSQENMLINLLENTFDGYWERDFVRDYQYMSPRYWTMLGYDYKEMRHHPTSWHKVISAEGLQTKLTNLDKHIRSRGRVPFEQTVKFKHKMGHDVWVLSKGHVVSWDSEGNPLKMVGTHTDVTDLVKQKDLIEKAKREIFERDAKILDLKTKSDDWFRVITNSLPQLMWTCVSTGPCDYLSEQWVQYTGVPEKNQLGYNWLNQLHPEDRERVISEWKQNTKRETIFSMKFRIRRHDGEYRWFDTMAIPLKSGNGEVIRWLGSNTDVQEIYKAKELVEGIKTRLEIATQGTHIGIWEWDIETNNLLWSDQMFLIYGIDKKKFKNNFGTWIQTFHPEDRVRGQDAIQNAIMGLKEFDEEFRILRENGEVVYVYGRAKVIRNEINKPIKMIGVNWDNSKMKLNELALQKATEEAISATKAKSEFLANMSHEIRTPLNGILGITRMIDMSGLPDELSNSIEIIRRSGENLLTLVNDILDFSKIEAGKLDVEHIVFDLKALIDDLYKQQTVFSKDKKITLSCNVSNDTPNLIKGDPGRLRQVLTNLISNSIKFTTKGNVTLRVSLEKNKMMLFEVEDTGIGIPESSLNKMFQAFTQVDASTTRRFGGSGLGLSICKRLVNLMKGEINVKSKYGEGTTFWFKIPFEDATFDEWQQNKKNDQEAKKTATNAKILIAEDNPINQEVMLRMLKRMGYQVHSVGDGSEVLDALRDMDYDLILMDCQMPEMDGFEATKIVRNSPTIRNNNIPILAVTASAIKEELNRCIDCGMNDYLTKPVNERELQLKIEKWLNQSKLVEEVRVA
ncbi:MAG: PAS domain-containing protein [Bdellovibrionales bacterium]|nr:PAS domain-containing protein [Bdellovibrionales bacterium]